MALTVVIGLYFTYFGPIFWGSYQRVPWIVHVHGWTFFAWYALLIGQAGLIKFRRLNIHRLIGLATIVLGALMVGVGLVTSTVRVDLANAPDIDPFWEMMGLPIFAIWILFTLFYGLAIYRRWKPADHKRLILLASAAALGAATFRVFVVVLGFEPWVAVIGTMAPNAFIVAAMAYDIGTTSRVHRVYAWGLPVSVFLVASGFYLAMSPSGELIKHAVGSLGRLLRPLYFG
jgi:hypothetical protein